MNSLRVLTLLVPCLLFAVGPTKEHFWRFETVGNAGPIMVGLFAIGFQLSNRFVFAKIAILFLFVGCLSASTVTLEFYYRPYRFQRGWYEGAPVPDEFLLNTALMRIELLILELLVYYVFARLLILIVLRIFRSQILSDQSVKPASKLRFLPQFSLAGCLCLMTIVALNLAIQRNVSDNTRDMSFEWRGLLNTLSILLISWMIVLLATRLRRIPRHVFLIGLWLLLPAIIAVLSGIFPPYLGKTNKPGIRTLTTWVAPTIGVIVQSSICIQVMLLWIESLKLGELLLDSKVKREARDQNHPTVVVHPLEA